MTSLEHMHNVVFTWFPLHVAMEWFHLFNTWKINHSVKLWIVTKKLRKTMRGHGKPYVCTCGCKSLQGQKVTYSCSFLYRYKNPWLIPTRNTYVKTKLCVESPKYRWGVKSVCTAPLAFLTDVRSHWPHMFWFERKIFAEVILQNVLSSLSYRRL